MVWMESSTVSLRQEFVSLACQGDANVRELCRRFGISPKTGYKWLSRFKDAGGDAASLEDRSRRPRTSPRLSTSHVQLAAVQVRHLHPTWGARKIAWHLQELQQIQVAPSTITHILRRHGLLDAAAISAAQHWQHFEHASPNELWQIDFKGHFKTLSGTCHALTLLDDHSRFNLLIKAIARTDIGQVQPQLVDIFRRYGLPVRINADNGPPWGSPSAGGRSLSELAVWLIRLGVRVSFSSPYHPQTNGKLERFHRTLNQDVIAGRHFSDLEDVQHAFDQWRSTYNCKRPHESLGMRKPIERYRPSAVAYPEQTPAIEYPDGDTVAVVGWNGITSFKGRKYRFSSALHRLPVGIRANPQHEGLFDVYFCHQRFAQIDLRTASSDTWL